MEYPKILISGSQNVFDEGWNGAGVYMVSGLYTSNSFSQPIYIGSSKNLQQRIEHDHISNLDRSSHRNPPLQCAWNAHAKTEGFIWWLLESCEPEQVLEVEQKWLDYYKPFVSDFNGFNVTHFAWGGTGTPNALDYKLISPEGEIVEGKNLSKLADEYNLQSGAFGELLNEKRDFYKGWRRHEEADENRTPEERAAIAKAIKSPTKANNIVEFSFVSPCGKIVTGRNIARFCRENNLSLNVPHCLKSGKHKIVKGWRLTSEEDISLSDEERISISSSFKIEKKKK